MHLQYLNVAMFMMYSREAVYRAVVFHCQRLGAGVT